MQRNKKDVQFDAVFPFILMILHATLITNLLLYGHSVCYKLVLYALSLSFAKSKLLPD